MNQSELDYKNSEYWNTLCGTNDAKALGIVDRSPDALRIFDDWFFQFYPYLEHYIPYETMKGSKVLEVGLGYGSLGQRVAANGADYTGLDVAHGPVEMMNYRVRLQGLNGRALRGSILNAPFPDGTFDHIVAIGCFHHTGNLPKAIDESYRLLRDGGQLIFMVYNGLSYRQWYGNWKATFHQFVTSRAQVTNSEMRARYDTTAGETAPHTDFVCRSLLRRYCRKFVQFEARLENVTSEPPFKRSREQLLKTHWPRLVGLDIYATAKK
jgi:SAM-dependent methyltransferase